VDLTDLEDVKVRVNDPAGDVLVHLGSSDYLRRYKIYVTHAQGWRQQFQKLESVDLRYDNQIIVNPEIQRTAKPVTLSPAVAKVAAAAGVKPAALVTRLSPHDRAMPKPAFELTEKKLDPKAGAAASKKPAAKTKIKKAAVKTGKAAADAKKESAGKPVAPSVAKSAARKKASPPATVKQRQSVATRPLVKPSSGGGQKPSPAVAKSQVSQPPVQ
jgi:cell division protein FtsQ